MFQMEQDRRVTYRDRGDGDVILPSDHDLQVRVLGLLEIARSLRRLSIDI
jgi:hypothetical protein